MAYALDLAPDGEGAVSAAGTGRLLLAGCCSAAGAEAGGADWGWLHHMQIKLAQQWQDCNALSRG